jgi:hypothetical protein
MTETENLIEEPVKEKLFQTVIITLSDGREAAFTGEVLVAEKSDDLSVTGINFLKPMPLPEGCVFEQIETDVDDFNPEGLPEVIAENSEEETE